MVALIQYLPLTWKPVNWIVDITDQPLQCISIAYFNYHCDIMVDIRDLLIFNSAYNIHSWSWRPPSHPSIVFQSILKYFRILLRTLNNNSPLKNRLEDSQLDRRCMSHIMLFQSSMCKIFSTRRILKIKQYWSMLTLRIWWESNAM